MKQDSIPENLVLRPSKLKCGLMLFVAIYMIYESVSFILIELKLVPPFRETINFGHFSETYGILIAALTLVSFIYIGRRFVKGSLGCVLVTITPSGIIVPPGKTYSWGNDVSGFIKNGSRIMIFYKEKPTDRDYERNITIERFMFGGKPFKAAIEFLYAHVPPEWDW